MYYYEYVIFVKRTYSSKLIYLVGNFDSHVRQQFGRFGGAIWTSHCLSFSNANGSPGWRTNGFCDNEIYKNKLKSSSHSWRHLLIVQMNRTNLPLQMLHCCPCPINRMLHLNSPALVHVASFSYFPDANLRHDPNKWDAHTIFMFTRIYLIPKRNTVRMCACERENFGISLILNRRVCVCVCWKIKKYIFYFWFISVISSK